MEVDTSAQLAAGCPVRGRLVNGGVARVRADLALRAGAAEERAAGVP